MPYPTARAAVTALVGVELLKETSGRARSQTFAYQAYMDLLR